MELPAESDSEAAPGGATPPEPTPVGEYAAGLTRTLRGLDRARLTGELSDVRRTRVQVYFQLRDERGGVPCAMWNNAFEALGLPDDVLRDGAQVIVSGGPDYYPGGKAASPAFSFRVTSLRPAGEGDLLARLAALRKQFDAEGLMKPQKALGRPRLPKRIGVITAEGGAARQDLTVGLERRGWQGEVVWGFAPVQDRKAAPLITRALADMATSAGVEAIVVCRGGGSLTDLWAFCDETLCRTVALLAVPVISAVGHERDVTLLDDVAAVRCSTPTHAAEAVVPLDCLRARQETAVAAAAIDRSARSAVIDRAAPLIGLAAGPGRAIKVQRTALNQRTREVRASSTRALGSRRAALGGSSVRHLEVSASRAAKAVAAARMANESAPDRLAAMLSKQLQTDRAGLERQALALRAHDPQRTLERGYARVEDLAGEPVVSGRAARRARNLAIHFADEKVEAHTGPAPRKSRSKRSGATDENQQTMFEETEGEPDE